LPESSELHRYELMEERRSQERRGGHRASSAVVERRDNDRRQDHSLASAPAVQRIFPIAEAEVAVTPSRRHGHQRAMLALADALVAGLAIICATSASGSEVSAFGVVGGALVAVLVARLTSLYERDQLVLRRSTLDEAPQLLELAAAVTLVYWLAFGAGLQRHGVVLLLIMLFGGLVAGRMVARLTTRKGMRPERCLFIGDLTVADYVKGKVECGRANAEVVAIHGLHPGQTAADIGGVESMRAMIKRNGVDRVIIAPVTTDAADTLELIRVAKLACAQVTIFPRLFEVIGSAVEFEEVEGMTLIGVRQFGLSSTSRALKRAFDLVVGSAIAVVLAPLMLAIALAIRVDSKGPILFRQTRIGRDDRPFEILKFRSMVPDAEALKAELRPHDAVTGLFKLRADPRVTRLGRLLRQTSLDELPQICNVLRGDMSLVGPRPLVMDEDDQVLGLDRSRLHLTPGMTGPWQVMRSGRVPMQEMVSIDYLYVANWSLWTDFKLLIRTAGYVVTRGGM
jgi:exopolysaccharide biosynthesis polyprenyl glycosylphosphotransferase